MITEQSLNNSILFLVYAIIVVVTVCLAALNKFLKKSVLFLLLFVKYREPSIVVVENQRFVWAT